GWGMLRLPMGELNLAPRLPGGPLRASLLLGTVIAVTACSRPTGPIAVGLAGPFSQPRGASMLRAAQLAVNQINAKRGIRGRKLELRVVDDSGNEDTAGARTCCGAPGSAPGRAGTAGDALARAALARARRGRPHGDRGGRRARGGHAVVVRLPPRPPRRAQRRVRGGLRARVSGTATG